ncbi:DnaA ATPase domain-containing protein [Stakelama marina]|uniref:Chromosomal replication initiator DnaA n=1 Tax=Stakelama marina TaxID=2826939 RepID=A0A8T4IBY9_9SPHN|nr:DnaA/Hda family protein [Stakelama marina]MBR0551612.1 chromosomal replication initiator DnaA [Stakelama marina]
MRQAELPLGWPADASEDEFLIGEANARAVRMLEHRASWPVMAAIITGPRKSGRSLLARIFATRSGGTLVDDAQDYDETELFHAWNRAQAERKPLLMVADAVPPEWEVQLPDLRSRLAATPVLRIDPPDDALMAALLERLFERRHILARPDVVQWLARRIERSYVAVLRVVDAIEDGIEGRRGRKLTIPVAKEVLGGSPLLCEPIEDEER